MPNQSERESSVQEHETKANDSNETEEEVFKRNLSDSLLEIDRDKRNVYYLIGASVIGVIIILIVSGIKLVLTEYSPIVSVVGFIYSLIISYLLVNSMRIVGGAPYKIFLRQNKDLQEELLSILDKNWQKNKVVDSIGKNFEYYLKKLRYATKVWADWRKKRKQYLRVFVLFTYSLLLLSFFLFQAIVLPDMSVIGALIIVFGGIPFYSIYLIILSSLAFHFNQIQLGRNILGDFTWRYLFENVRIPLEIYVRSNDRAIDKKTLLVPISNWDKFYRQAFFTNSQLNSLLRAFHVFLFPLSTKQYYITLFQDVKTRLQSISFLNTLDGIKGEDNSAEIEQILGLLDLYLENLKASSELLKEGERQRWEKSSSWISITLSILALVVSIFFR